MLIFNKKLQLVPKNSVHYRKVTPTNMSATEVPLYYEYLLVGLPTGFITFLVAKYAPITVHTNTNH